MAKNIEQKSIVYTPFYSKSGWEFLDQYFEHKRLRKEKAQDYFCETKAWLKESGFDRMWKNVKELEMGYYKLMSNDKRYGKVHENLQMYVDE